jgi:hypothetical protein
MLFVILDSQEGGRKLWLRLDQVVAVEELREPRQLSASGAVVKLACGAEYLVRQTPPQVTQRMSDVVAAVEG